MTRPFPAACYEANFCTQLQRSCEHARALVAAHLIPAMSAEVLVDRFCPEARARQGACRAIGEAQLFSLAHPSYGEQGERGGYVVYVLKRGSSTAGWQRGRTDEHGTVVAYAREPVHACVVRSRAGATKPPDAQHLRRRRRTCTHLAAGCTPHPTHKAGQPSSPRMSFFSFKRILSESHF